MGECDGAGDEEEGFVHGPKLEPRARSDWGQVTRLNPRQTGAHAGVNTRGPVQRVKELGAPLSIPEAYEPGRRAYAFDPDGHELELFECAT